MYMCFFKHKSIYDNLIIDMDTPNILSNTPLDNINFKYPIFINIHLNVD